jgi:hypothetical protein
MERSRGKFTLHSICLLARYPQVSMIRCDFLLFLLAILGNLFHQLGGVGLLASCMGDLGFRGDKLWSLFQIRQESPKVRP